MGSLDPHIPCSGVHLLKAPTTDKVIDYVTNLAPPQNSLIGGDFNARNEAFEPGVANANRGGEIAQWSSDSGLDFIGEPGVPTHQAGHVLDLTFSNIPYASTVVREDLATGSDHESLVTRIPVAQGGLYTRLSYQTVPSSDFLPAKQHRTMLDQFAASQHFPGRYKDTWPYLPPDTMEKAEALRRAVLGRFAQRRRPNDPIPITTTSSLPWLQSVTMEEVEAKQLASPARRLAQIG
ncbi:hypothetical protein PDIDSM_598 [Penicillium digitatum]|nr:hypothetical protein PDIDSM_598 [Penicillium digitatum]